MELKLVYYNFSGSGDSILEQYLTEFKEELSGNITSFSDIEILNGQETFRGTYNFIKQLIESKILNSEIHFDDLCSNLRKANDDISQSLKIKTLICLEKGLRFKNQSGAHGLSEFNGRYAVLLKVYKNIVWHEVAHLFGADDHYIENDTAKMKKQCSAKKKCVMQYDPSEKPCCFCSTAIEEIRSNMIKETSPLSIDDL